MDCVSVRVQWWNYLQYNQTNVLNAIRIARLANIIKEIIVKAAIMKIIEFLKMVNVFVKIHIKS